MKKDTKGMSAGKVVAIGASVAALAAASYYFFGPEGKKNQKTMKGWMIKMKGDVVDKMEDAKEVTEAVYNQIVDTVAAKYAKSGKSTAADVMGYVDILKKQWKGIAKSTAGKKSAVKKAVKKVAKAVSKSPAKKTTSAK